MPFPPDFDSTKSYSNILDLDKKRVYREEKPTVFGESTCFSIKSLPDILNYGKHYFTISFKNIPGQRYYLKPYSKVLFEFKDEQGTVIFSDASSTANAEGTVVCYVWVKEDPLRTFKSIVNGFGTLTIVGELADVPREWKDTYNYKVQWPIEVRPELPTKNLIGIGGQQFVSYASGSDTFITIDADREFTSSGWSDPIEGSHGVATTQTLPLIELKSGSLELYKSRFIVDLTGAHQTAGGPLQFITQNTTFKMTDSNAVSKGHIEIIGGGSGSHGFPVLFVQDGDGDLGTMRPKSSVLEVHSRNSSSVDQNQTTLDVQAKWSNQSQAGDLYMIRAQTATAQKGSGDLIGVKVKTTTSGDYSGDKWSGYFEDGNFYIEENLGIGTATPGKKLEVVGDISASGTLYANAFEVTHFTSSYVTASTIQTEGNTIFGDESSDRHTFNGDIDATGTVSASNFYLTASAAGGVTVDMGIHGDDGIAKWAFHRNNVRKHILYLEGRNDAGVPQDSLVFKHGLISDGDDHINFHTEQDDQTVYFHGDITVEGSISASGDMFFGALGGSSFISSSGDLFLQQNQSVGESPAIVLRNDTNSPFARSNLIFSSGSHGRSVGNDTVAFEFMPYSLYQTFKIDNYQADGIIQLRTSGSTRLEVENNGIDVTGHITASGNISCSGDVITTIVNFTDTRVNTPTPTISESKLYVSGSENTLYWSGDSHIRHYPLYPKKRQYYHHNFWDNFGDSSSPAYLPWFDQSEGSTGQGGVGANLFICDARLLKVFARFGTINGDAEITVELRYRAGDSSAEITRGSVAKDIADGEEHEVHLFDFSSANNTIPAGSNVSILAWADDAGFHTNNRGMNWTSVWELDYSTELTASIT